MDGNQFLKIEQEPIFKYIENISADGILIAKNNEISGSLVFSKGRIVSGEINNKFGNDKASEIVFLKKGSYFFQKVEKKFTFKASYINKFFNLIEFLNLDAKVSFKSNRKNYEFYFSEGVIVDIIPDISNDYDVINIVNNVDKESEIVFNKTNVNNGNLKIFFSEISLQNLHSNKNTPTINNEEVYYEKIKKNINKILNQFDFKIKSVYVYSQKDNSVIYNSGFSKKQTENLRSICQQPGSESYIFKESANKKMLIDTSDCYIILMQQRNFYIFVTIEKSEINIGLINNVIFPVFSNTIY